MSDLNKSIRKEILLIGPMAAGKSTISLLLSQKLEIPCFPIDEIKWFLVYRKGYNISTAKEILLSKGFLGKMNYFYNYFDNEIIDQIFTEFQGGVFDLGATHIYHNNDIVFGKIRNLFFQFQNVFLIQPTNNFSQNVKILNQRILERYNKLYEDSQIINSYMTYNKFLLKNKIFDLYTKKVICTESKTLEQIVLEILQKME